jgi:hypothetical protein
MKPSGHQHPDYMESLIKVIEHTHGLKATFLEHAHVTEYFGDKVAWAGQVEVFKVSHPKASKVYAWSYEKAGKPEYVAVLEIPPVTSPQTAVQAFIVSETKQK